MIPLTPAPLFHPNCCLNPIVLYPNCCHNPNDPSLNCALCATQWSSQLLPSLKPPPPHLLPMSCSPYVPLLLPKRCHTPLSPLLPNYFLPLYSHYCFGPVVPRIFICCPWCPSSNAAFTLFLYSLVKLSSIPTAVIVLLSSTPTAAPLTFYHLNVSSVHFHGIPRLDFFSSKHCFIMSI